MTWPEIRALIEKRAVARGFIVGNVARDSTDEYSKRLHHELKEIDKQGAINVMASKFNAGYDPTTDTFKPEFVYHTNKNGLVFPWLLGMTDVDPLVGKHDEIQQTDWPDIDVDCVPEARDLIKTYAAEKYGQKKVCSVGTWMTYKFRLAIADVVRAYGGNGQEAKLLTTNLPDSVDDLKDGGYAKCTACKRSHKDLVCPKCGGKEVDGVTICQLLQEYENLRVYNKLYPEVIEMAVRLVGKIKSLGMHAGGLIIADRELFGNVPMALKNGKWTSMWTEGRIPQLSKFGYVKWDVLGLKTLGYINQCCKLLAKTRGYRFDILPWERQDKINNVLGKYEDNLGVIHEIRMDDPDVIKMINDLRVETVFQFETDVQRGILSNKISSYYDLQVLNALGHPGPMDMIPDYVHRRDNPNVDWRLEEHPEMAELLKETFGIIVYQEQLQAAWMKFGGFTAPEAEAARKAVAKKWVDKLKPIGERWLAEATITLGPYTGPLLKNKDKEVIAEQPKTWAEVYWDRMVTFGRYAFNQCIDKDTLLENPESGEIITADELARNPRSYKLLSYDGSAFFADDVVRMIDSGPQEMYEIEFDNGIKKFVTLNHKLLCDDGEYHEISSIIREDRSVRVRSEN